MGFHVKNVERTNEDEEDNFSRGFMCGGSFKSCGVRKQRDPRIYEHKQYGKSVRRQLFKQRRDGKLSRKQHFKHRQHKLGEFIFSYGF